ncbi:SigB/SigF/SigG family RNA polymerase sigma factor [Dactylosporangium sp. CA-139066]|uniref:SigB/SigF/SigG family RNA polymerase sigma factor n=1 Tax=Dactylosporangium sp. CA-139066 TaxID=3239930 RepID=UPI003D8B167F
MDLCVLSSTRGNRCLLELSGVLDYASAPYVRQLVFRQLDAGAHDIVIEVSRVRVLDAGAIKVVLYLRRRAEQIGAGLRLAGATGTVLSALEITGVAKELHAYDDSGWPVRHRVREPVPLDDLQTLPGHFPAEATELVGRLRGLDPGDPARARARDEVIELCLPMARRLARRYGATEPVSDLTQVAALGLVKAVDGFDSERGIDFGAYATPTIVGEIKRYFRDRTSGVRVPRRLQELRLRVNAARDELVQALQRSPTVSDLAVHLGEPEEAIIEVVAAGQAYRPLSLEAPAAGAADDSTLGETVGGDAPEYDLIDHRESLRRVIARLPAREQRILSLRFYGNHTQSEIAQQVGLSQMHVSRLLAHSLAFLRRHLDA